MKYSFAALAFAAAVSALPQAAPEGSADCPSSYSGTFEIEVVNVTSSKRAVEKRAALMLTLSNGVLKDAEGRVGYIASNNQFQFDYSVNGGPPQTGAKITSGWGVCPNNTLVLGPDAVFQQCLSGTFYNLYDENSAAQCSPVYIEVVGSGGSAEQGDGQVTAVSQQHDGQPTELPVSQISDGQPQEVTQITDGQIQAPTGAVLTQLSDGQPQAPTGAVSQISDGQPQAPTGAPVSQISDGQPQAPKTTAAPVSQISDGQVQAPTSAPVVSQISDGQVQAPTSAAVVSQISDGQIQAPTNASSVAMPSATVQPFTGAASFSTVRSELFGLAAGILAIAML